MIARRHQASGEQRALLAQFCRTLGKPKGAPAASPSPAPPPVPGVSPHPALGPRLRQTLDRLLAGDSEKQIAATLKLSQHTVHDYVKTVYRRFNVNSRAELLALWVRK